MKNTSLIKISISLFIIGIYVFLFGILGTVEGSAELVEAEETVSSSTTPPEASQTEATVANRLPQIPDQGFSYSTTLNVENGAKPLMGDYSNSAPEITEETENAETADTQASTEDEPDFTVDDSGYVAETTTTPQTTTTTQAATETTPEETTTEEITTEETTTEEVTTTEAPSSAFNQQLTVYYSGSGGNVTGDAADILAQVVMGEIGGQFDPEAIKAQAIAAYTYIKYYNDNGSVPYVAVRTPNQTVIDCVNEVLGKALYYNGSLIQSVYGASTAGYTASSKNVWGVDYPYLQSKYCELDSLYDPNYGVKLNMTSDELKNLVYNSTGISLSGDPSGWITIENYVDTVFVGNMTIGGQGTYVNSSGKTVTITGRVFREQITGFKLRSACFEVSYDASSDCFTFTTYGYGHCVGLSQHGANLLATYKDYNYEQILQFYFPGTEIR